ncbi:MAG: PHP domain-containing protein [Marmoricola sp.]
MPEQFVHLHVASGYSLRYGTTHPHLLVERAAEFEMDALALTDRDGVYGAVRFANACRAAGIRPILGVDLAVCSNSPDYCSPASWSRAQASYTGQRWQGQGSCLSTRHLLSWQ